MIVEACRSPEVDKGDTEGVVLSRFFKVSGIDFVLYSNDGVWPDRLPIDRNLIACGLGQSSVDVVHLAMHGLPEGLVLRWSSTETPAQRRVLDLLPPDEIAGMEGWRGRLIISGACESAYIADAFVAAGATGVIAPATAIPWRNLGEFFKAFYTDLKESQDPSSALATAIAVYPEYMSFKYVTN